MMGYSLVGLLILDVTHALSLPARSSFSPPRTEDSSSFLPDLITRRETGLLAAATTVALLHQPNVEAISPTLLAEGDAIVRSLWLGRLAYPVVVSAVEVGLFEALSGNRPQSQKALSERLDLDPRALEALMSTCCGLGLLQKTSDGWKIPEAVRPFLLEDSPYYFGPQLLAADGTQATLRRALARKGDKKAGSVKYTAHSAASVESFVASMEAHSRATAECAAVALKDELIHFDNLLDMAGGSGCFSRALVRADPRRRLRATIADVPVVARMHRDHPNRYIENDVRDRMTVVDADLFKEDAWPKGHDAVLLANVLHDWSPEEAQTILRNAFTCLPTRGTVIIIEALMNDDATGPLHSGLYSISMLLGDWRTGKQYSQSQLFDMLQDAGFENPERIEQNCGNFHSALVARKLA